MILDLNTSRCLYFNLISLSTILINIHFFLELRLLQYFKFNILVKIIFLILNLNTNGCLYFNLISLSTILINIRFFPEFRLLRYFKFNILDLNTNANLYLNHCTFFLEFRPLRYFKFYILVKMFFLILHLNKYGYNR